MALDEREQGRTASHAELRARLPRANRFFFEGALSNPRLALMDLQAVSLAPAVSPQVRRLSEARLAEELSVAPVGRRVAIAMKHEWKAIGPHFGHPTWWRLRLGYRPPWQGHFTMPSRTVIWPA